MRKGWKTRIEERLYFEIKKQNREEGAIKRQILMHRMRSEIDQKMAEMKANHETH
jgi:hypothetical protein